MESQSGCNRSTDQLQSIALQNQAVQSESVQDGMTTPLTCERSAKSEKVVIQLGTEVIKGYLESQTWNTIEAVLRNAPDCPPRFFTIRRLGSDVVEEIPTDNAKAVFYVNDFDGDTDHRTLNFHSRAPIVLGTDVTQ